MAYQRIAEYGVIGDLHSAALVGVDGSIDWCCLPHFDSPSVFARILDHEKGGYFRIVAPKDDRWRRQMYLPETNVLMTRFLSPEGVGEVVDFMPIRNGTPNRSCGQIVRVVHGVRGHMPFRMECLPAFDYARASHETNVEGNVVEFRAGSARLRLLCSTPVRREGNAAVSSFELGPNETAAFVLQWADGDPCTPDNLVAFGEDELQRTMKYWQSWAAKCNYQGRWREMVVRSALTLKLLTFEPTGAIVAAVTTSLPEELGGVRNWDYRYTWIRDSAFTIYALLRLGYTEEASRFMNWIHDRATEHDTEIGPLQLMYGIDGRSELQEYELPHLHGYKGSKPVRIGNAASRQLQLDVYGELIDSIYLYNKYVEPISYDLWLYLRRMLHWVGDNWQRPDHGIWEIRGEPQQHVYSKVQCWVALDRGQRIAMKRGLPLEFGRVQSEATKIYEEVMRSGWNSQLKSFVQHFGTDAVDASALMLPLMMFVAPNDPRMIGTLDRIMQQLVSDSLCYRYEPGRASGDALPGHEGTFSICTFWLVEVLARAGRLQEARFVFDKMLTYANHLGLYSEEIGPSGELLGNFPQAFTHLGLISAAFDLDRRLKS